MERVCRFVYLVAPDLSNMEKENKAKERKKKRRSALQEVYGLKNPKLSGVEQVITLPWLQVFDAIPFELRSWRILSNRRVLTKVFWVDRQMHSALYKTFDNYFFQGRQEKRRRAGNDARTSGNDDVLGTSYVTVEHGVCSEVRTKSFYQQMVSTHFKQSHSNAC